MLDKIDEITELYNASNMFDVAFELQFNGIYQVGYHCQRRVHHCYAGRILTVLRSLGANATDATFMQALGIEWYDERFSQLARVQHALGDLPLIKQTEKIRAVFAGLDVEVTTHDKAIVLRRSGSCEVMINDRNAVDFFVFFLPNVFAYNQSDVFDYNTMAAKSFITSQLTMNLG